MTHGSLFSGLGGFDLAAEYMGWTNVFCCERDNFCQRVLQHHFPKSKLYDDVKTFKADKYLGRIDVLTGGFPCQPFSHAGKRQGTEDERHLWPEMLRIIRECSPRWIVGENVLGIRNWNDGMVFEEVCADLETCGYSVQPFVLPAAGVNAPHRRDRVFFVAYSDSAVCKRRDSEGTTTRTAESQVGTEPPDRTGSTPIATDTENIGRGGSSSKEREERRDGVLSGKCEGREMGCKVEGRSGEWAVPNTNRDGLQRGDLTKERIQQPESQEPSTQRIPPRRETLRFEEFPTVSPVCGGDDGLPERLDGLTFPAWRRESLKGYGNAICVPLVMNIFEAIKNYDETI